MEERYQKRMEAYKGLSNSLDKPMGQLILWKVLALIIAVLQGAYFYDQDLMLWALTGLGLMLIFFIWLQSKHKRLQAYKKDLDLMVAIHQKDLLRVQGKWQDFEDTGKDFLEKGHAYGYDLDIVGKDSLFQWTSQAGTPWGRKQLADYLLNPQLDSEVIGSKQVAIEELAGKKHFRNRLQLATQKWAINEKELTNLVEWGQVSQPIYRATWVRIVYRVLPGVTLLSLLLGLILNVIPSLVPVVLLVVHFLLLRFGKNARSHYLASVNSAYMCLKKSEAVFRLMEKYSFQASALKALKESFTSGQDHLPSKQIKQLASIAANVSSRNNMFYFVLNILFLWDYQCCISLEKWKNRSGAHLNTWFEVIGHFEALSSLAQIAYDHPDWATPKLLAQGSKTYIQSQSAGHPLIEKTCVTNSITFDEGHSIGLITGSNMSGKSTFLRTLGVNLVLAYTGAPVYARTFACQLLSVATCMRISDDLQNNVSSFYGEILRIKLIIDQVKAGQQVFFLLDEIFKGTNSMDRHTAAKAVINNLKNHGAIGLVSTHDLELSELEEESLGAISNHHFEETYEAGKIHFDYTLKEGVSITRNAIYLIEAAGIDMTGDKGHED